MHAHALVVVARNDEICEKCDVYTTTELDENDDDYDNNKKTKANVNSLVHNIFITKSFEILGATKSIWPKFSINF